MSSTGSHRETTKPELENAEGMSYDTNNSGRNVSEGKQQSDDVLGFNDVTHSELNTDEHSIKNPMDENTREEVTSEEANARDIIKELDELMEGYLHRLGINDNINQLPLQWRDMPGNESIGNLHEAEHILRRCMKMKMGINSDDYDQGVDFERQYYRKSARTSGDEQTQSEFGKLADKLERGIRRSMKKVAQKNVYRSYVDHCLRTT